SSSAPPPTPRAPDTRRNHENRKDPHRGPEIRDFSGVRVASDLAQPHRPTRAFSRHSILLGEGGADRGRADAHLRVVDIEPYPAAVAQLAAMGGSLEVVRRPSAGGEVEVALDAQTADLEPAGLDVIAVLLRHLVRRLHVVDRPGPLPDARSHTRVDIRLVGPAPEPARVLSRAE